MQMLGGKDALAQCRTDDIMADAAYVVLTRDSRARTGEFLIDEDVLRDVGVTDFEPYSCVPGMTCLQKKGLALAEATLTDGGGGRQFSLGQSYVTRVLYVQGCRRGGRWVLGYP